MAEPPSSTKRPRVELDVSADTHTLLQELIRNGKVKREDVHAVQERLTQQKEAMAQAEAALVAAQAQDAELADRIYKKQRELDALRMQHYTVKQEVQQCQARVSILKAAQEPLPTPTTAAKPLGRWTMQEKQALQPLVDDRSLDVRQAAEAFRARHPDTKRKQDSIERQVTVMRNEADGGGNAPSPSATVVSQPRSVVATTPHAAAEPFVAPIVTAAAEEAPTQRKGLLGSFLPSGFKTAVQAPKPCHP